jgi:autotransporter-associated beta strand protein
MTTSPATRPYLNGPVDSSSGIGVNLFGGQSNTIDAVANITGTTGIKVDGGSTMLTSSSGSTTIAGTTALDIDSGRLVIGNGVISLNGNIADDGTLVINRSTGLTIAGAIFGAGSLEQNGTGTTILAGTNSYTGATTVNAGTLQVDGSLTSPITVQSGATLKGNGAIGDVNFNGGTLAPGASAGILSSRNVILSASTTYEVEIGGSSPGAGGYDQLKVTGAVVLGQATLSTLMLNGFDPAHGIQLMIVENDQSDAVVGTFAGLGEGSIFANGSATFRISYVGGDGNDVVLTALDSPAPARGDSAPPDEAAPPSDVSASDVEQEGREQAAASGEDATPGSGLINLDDANTLTLLDGNDRFEFHTDTAAGGTTLADFSGAEGDKMLSAFSPCASATSIDVNHLRISGGADVHEPVMVTSATTINSSDMLFA